MSSFNRELTPTGVLAASISNSMVKLLHRYTGRGPTRARTTVGENIIVCVMGATLTRGEQSLAENGKTEVVLQTRRAFQETMQADAISAVEELSGRQVVAFMSNNHIDPDLAVEVFILEPVRSEILERAQVDRDGPNHNGNGLVLDGRGPDLDGHGPESDGHDLT
jgi:uncharacterized protein YbcI